jgi:aminoglycoside 3-N-acetyltransferase
VVLLGAPLQAISLLHHAEAVARAPKRFVRYELPVAGPGGVRWRAVRELDVWSGPFPYEERGEPPLAVIAREALAAGAGARGRVGDAAAHVFCARRLVAFAVDWLEQRFSPRPGQRGRHRRSAPGR